MALTRWPTQYQSKNCFSSKTALRKFSNATSLLLLLRIQFDSWERIRLFNTMRLTRTFTSLLASDPKCRPPSAQPRTQLSMVTCPGQRTMEATRGNGYAPAWGSLVMMMMMDDEADQCIWCTSDAK